MKRPIMERFTEKYMVDEATGCWLWQACRNHKRGGYGMFSVGHAKAAWAHRVSYELHVGPIPAGMVLDHLCRTPACVNPAHLEAVPQRINALRGAAPTVLTFHKGTCQRGHDMTGENAYVKKDGHRFCRTCERAAKVFSRSDAQKVPCYACDRTYTFENLMRHLRRSHGLVVTPPEVRQLLSEKDAA